MKRSLVALAAGVMLTPTVAFLGSAPAEAIAGGFTLTQCKARPDRTILIRRFDFCLRTKVGTTDTVSKKVVGTLSANVTMVASAPKFGSRTVTYTLSLSSVKAVGSLTGATLRMAIPCAGTACGGEKSATKLIAVWKAQPKATYKWTASLGTDPAKSTRGKTSIYGEVSGGGGPTKRTAVRTVATFRCDKAGYNNNKDGCVFTAGIPTFQPSATDPAIDESTAHILHALYKPEDTVPYLKGKTIPGLTTPLHRLRDDAGIRKNRRAATAACGKEFPGYASKGKQCDEYPFAATREGAAKGAGRFSVTTISGTDNRAGGGALQQFYRANRILDNDPFYVSPKP